LRNIKLTIEYDGTEYVGWQRQPSGRTVQAEIERALESMTGERTVVNGSGRRTRPRADGELQDRKLAKSSPD
jgi:tRNA pseudouridine38-40 synthase